MSQWYDPMKTPEGQLLQEVQELLKSVKDKKKPKGYKSDRGDREMPKLPSPKGNTNKLASDMSDNCPLCGANPHEECGMPGRSGEHQAINCKLNPIAFDSRMDDLREPESMREHIPWNGSDKQRPNHSRHCKVRARTKRIKQRTPIPKCRRWRSGTRTWIYYQPKTTSL